MGEVVDWLENGDLDAHVVVRAAMAHLHVVSVHPFRDGNGRISRIVQSLVLAREGLVSPEFGSIEEYLGAHTQEYYAALREARAAATNPNATPPLGRLLRQGPSRAGPPAPRPDRGRGRRWDHLEELVEARGWPDRLVIALEQSLIGGTDRSTYGDEADVSPATASADFRRLLDARPGRATRARTKHQLPRERASAGGGEGGDRRT